MSKLKYDWWSFALAMIRGYPERSLKLKRIHQQKTTADITGMPRSGGTSRTTEGVALRQLPLAEQRKYEAVHTAIRRTGYLKESKLRMGVVRMTLWGSYKLGGAALVLNISESTAQLYRWDFVMMTAVAHELITEEEYQEARKKRVGKTKV